MVTKDRKFLSLLAKVLKQEDLFSGKTALVNLHFLMKELMKELMNYTTLLEVRKR